MSVIRHALGMCVAGLLAGMVATPAAAELVLSELIVELQPAKQVRRDIEIWNNSPDRSFVAIEPREIVHPALPDEHGRADPDPEKLGLLVSPARMILEPRQRKIIRIASLSTDGEREHVYRVTVRPVAGEVDSEDSGLKILVGYDLLVLVRPVQPSPDVSANRTGRKLTFSNSGNVSVEVINGHQCDENKAHCADLPGKRLYPGASWTVELNSDLPAEYTLKSPGRSERRVY